MEQSDVHVHRPGARHGGRTTAADRAETGSPAATVELSPTRFAPTGDAVARDAEGKSVYIKGALPGERVRVEILVNRRRYSSGRVVELLEASPDRTTPPCPEVEHGCGACQWQHMSIPTQRRLKTELIVEALARFGEVEPPRPEPVVELEPWAFRTTVRAGVVDGRAGFRGARSNSVVPVDACLVAHPLLADLLLGRRYQGAEEVLLRCGARTGERLVSTTPPDVVADLPSDVRRHDHHEFAAGRLWRVSARSFFQSRPDATDALAELVKYAASEVGPPARAVDLYSGVGIFAGVLAEQGWSVTAVEGDSSSVRDARANLSGLDVRVVRGDVTKWSPSQAEFVVADPSRAGLGHRGVAAVVGTGAGRLVLVSCDAESLGRDAAMLARAGFELTSVTEVDMFPHTFRVEVLAVFDR
jgi:23S rRNA (uracil1939-C5)-methyltransferase